MIQINSKTKPNKLLHLLHINSQQTPGNSMNIKIYTRHDQRILLKRVVFASSLFKRVKMVNDTQSQEREEQ